MHATQKTEKHLLFFFFNNNDRGEFVKGKLKFRSIFDLIFAAYCLHTNSMNDKFSWTPHSKYNIRFARLIIYQKGAPSILFTFAWLKKKTTKVTFFSWFHNATHLNVQIKMYDINEHVFSWSMVDELKASPK